jgi:hypothetical protein
LHLQAIYTVFQDNDQKGEDKKIKKNFYPSKNNKFVVEGFPNNLDLGVKKRAFRPFTETFPFAPKLTRSVGARGKSQITLGVST